MGFSATVRTHAADIPQSDVEYLGSHDRYLLFDVSDVVMETMIEI